MGTIVDRYRYGCRQFLHGRCEGGDTLRRIDEHEREATGAAPSTVVLFLVAIDDSAAPVTVRAANEQLRRYLCSVGHGLAHRGARDFPALNFEVDAIGPEVARDDSWLPVYDRAPDAKSGVSRNILGLLDSFTDDSRTPLMHVFRFLLAHTSPLLVGSMDGSHAAPRVIPGCFIRRGSAAYSLNAAMRASRIPSWKSLQPSSAHILR